MEAKENVNILDNKALNGGGGREREWDARLES